MKNTKKAFTMIELIFVIVIIGILAAVALPKLAATRDDAKIANIIANARILTGDMTAFYTSQGTTSWTTDATSTADKVTVVPGYTDGSCTSGNVIGAGSNIKDIIYICDAEGGTECIRFDANDTHLTVTPIASGGTNMVCEGVVTDPTTVSIAGTNADPKIYQLGGVAVVR